jgi:hypothetical protein
MIRHSPYPDHCQTPGARLARLSQSEKVNFCVEDGTDVGVRLKYAELAELSLRLCPLV